MEKDLILKEADDYIRQNGENVKSERNEEAFRCRKRLLLFMKKLLIVQKCSGERKENIGGKN